MRRRLLPALLTALLVASLLPSISWAAALQGTASIQFTDVPADHPYRSYILFLAQKGLINGYPDGRFGPDDALNRAAATKIAIQVAGLAAQSTGQSLDFTDLPESHWSAGYVRAAVANDLVKGFEDKSFRPNEPVTRAQLAALAIRATRQPTSSVPTGIQLDDVKPGDWFQADALLAVAAGLMVAPNGSFRPNEPATRAEAARAFAQAIAFTPVGFATPLAVIVEPRAGLVEIQQPNSTVWTTITESTQLQEEGRVRTAGASSANLGFPDGSAFLLDSNSELIVHKSRGTELVTSTGVEEVDVELVSGKVLFALTPRATASELQAYAPALARFTDRGADARAAAAMAPRVRAAQSGSGQNLPARATRLMLFSDPASLQPGDTAGADLTVVLVDEAGEPVTADQGDVTLELISDVGRFSNANPVITRGAQAVTVKLYPPDTEPEDAKTRVTAVAGEVTSAMTIPTSKVSWWQGLFSKKTRATVRMPWSVASVRGTIGEAEATGRVNKAKILNGSMEMRSASGDKVEVSNNQSTGVSSPDESPDTPKPLDKQDKDSFGANKQWLLDQTKQQRDNASDEFKDAVDAASDLIEQYVEQELPKDTVPPVISISSPANGSRLGSATAIVTGSASDDVKLASVRVGASSVAVGDNVWKAQVSLKAGENLITATATDGEGNTSSASVTLFFDAALPSISLSAPPSTKESQLTVSGSFTTPGGFKSLTLNGSPISGGTAGGPAGSFSATIELEPGRNAIEATVTDSLDRSASQTAEIILANLPPDITLGAGETTVGNPKYTVSGVAVAQYTELDAVSVNGKGVLFSDDGFFQTQLELKLGPNAITVTATDEAGNTASTSRTVTVDAAIPTVKLTQPRDGLITRESSLRIHGVAAAAAGIASVAVNGLDVTPAQGDSFDATLTLVEGENLITAVLTGALGGTASDSRKVYLLTRPPSVVISQPADGARAAQRDIAVSGSAAASFGPLASINVNGKSVLTSEDGSFATVVSLASGTNTIAVTAADSAGTTASETRTVTFNPAAPVLSLSSPADGLITKEKTLTVSGSVQNGEDVTEVSVNGASAPVSGGSFSRPVTLNSGKNTITVSLPATAGGASIIRTVILADQPPTLSVSQPAEGTKTAQSNVTVSGSALTAFGTPAVVSVGGNLVPVSGSGGFSATVPLTKRGPNAITISASDSVGNTASITRTVNYEPAAPLISILSPANNATAKTETISVSGNVTSTVGIASVSINGASASVTESGAFSGTVSLKPGPNPISVVATDKLGGSSDKTITVVRGGIPPELSISAPSEGFTSGVATITVTGSARAVVGKIVGVSVNGTPAAVSADGSWVAKVTLAVGDNTITAQAADDLGGSASASRKVRFQPGAPSLLLSAPADGAVVVVNSVVVRGNARANTGSLRVQVNGSSVSPGADGAFETTVSNLQGGPNTITVTVTDEAGQSASASRTVNFANQPPTISISSPADGATLTQSTVTVAGRVTVQTGLRLTAVTVNGLAANYTAEGNFSATVPVSLTGDTVINVSATDSANRTASASRTVRLPQLSVSASAPANTGDESFTVSGQVQGAVGPISVTVNGQGATISGTGYSVTLPVSKVGANPVSVIASDSAGRKTTASASVTFTPAPISLSASAPTSSTTTPVNVTGSASSKYGGLTVTVGGQSFNLGTGGGFTASIGLVSGPNAVTVSAQDKWSTASQSLSISYAPPTGGGGTPPPAAPTLTLTSPPDGATTGNLVTVAGTYTAAPGLKSLTVNGQTATASGGSFSFPLKLAEVGTASVAVIVTDTQDRLATSTRTINVTGLIPTITSPVDGSYGAHGLVTLHGTATPGGTLYAVVDGVKTTSPGTADELGAYSLEVAATEGAHQFAVREESGTRIMESETILHTVDLTVPRLTVNGIGTPLPGTLASVRVTGTASDPNLDKVYVTAGSYNTPTDNDLATLTAVSGGATYSIDLLLTDTDTMAVVWAVDKAGNMNAIELPLQRLSGTLPQIRLVARTQPVSTGQSIVVDVYLDNVAANLGSATVELAYDMSELTLTDTTIGPLLGGSSSQNVIKTGEGSVQINVSDPGGPTPVADANYGLLASLTFTANDTSSYHTYLSLASISGLAGPNGLLLLDTAATPASIDTDPYVPHLDIYIEQPYNLK